ncbi:hypothetical protein [Arthrobacter sp. Br18]|uniref:hypothetical protein n=1 Tax=Arthrobacter sp. Br18 TaxID=1312954 RepID=UPI00047A2A7B|nr:hypothetical protein [Arthrobacter sp. Br18]
MSTSSVRSSSSRTGDAERLKKPSWRDPRLLVGLLLVLASTAGIVALIGSVDRTTEVLAAKSDIAVGSPLVPDDFDVVPVRLGDLEEWYVLAADGLPERPIATRLIKKGELVPTGTVGTADELDRKPVGLSVADPLPTGTAAGARVDVWVSLRGQGTAFDKPVLLLEAAEVSEITVNESALGANSSTLVHVLVDDRAMPDLLNALSNEAAIAVVLNPGGDP